MRPSSESHSSDFFSKPRSVEELVGTLGTAARVQLHLLWKCEFGSTTCTPSLQAYAHTTSEAERPTRTLVDYIQSGNATLRNVYWSHGVEITVRSRAEIAYFSVLQVILHLSCLSILLAATDVAVDYYAETCFPRSGYVGRREVVMLKYDYAEKVESEGWEVLDTPEERSESGSEEYL